MHVTLASWLTREFDENERLVPLPNKLNICIYLICVSLSQEPVGSRGDSLLDHYKRTERGRDRPGIVRSWNCVQGMIGRNVRGRGWNWSVRVQVIVYWIKLWSKNRF